MSYLQRQRWSLSFWLLRNWDQNHLRKLWHNLNQSPAYSPYIPTFDRISYKSSISCCKRTYHLPLWAGITLRKWRCYRRRINSLSAPVLVCCVQGPTQPPNNKKQTKNLDLIPTVDLENDSTLDMYRIQLWIIQHIFMNYQLYAAALYTLLLLCTCNSWESKILTILWVTEVTILRVCCLGCVCYVLGSKWGTCNNTIKYCILGADCFGNS